MAVLRPQAPSTRVGAVAPTRSRSEPVARRAPKRVLMMRPALALVAGAVKPHLPGLGRGGDRPVRDRPDLGADDVIVWTDEPCRKETDVPDVHELDAERCVGPEGHVVVELQVLMVERALALRGLLIPPQAGQTSGSAQVFAVRIGVV